MLAGLISVAFGQDASWDLQNYHLYNAFALLHPARWHDFGFAQSQSFLNPIFDLPLYALASAFPAAPRLVAFCMGLPFGVLAFFTLRVARRLLGEEQSALALLAAAIGLTGTATISQIGLSSNEVLVAMFILASLDALLLALEPASKTPLRRVAAAGLLAGLAAGGKLTAAPFALGLAAAIIAALPPRRAATALAVLAVSGAAGAAVTGGFWMAHLVHLYGNPIFPYANHVFKSPWAGAYGYNDTRFLPRSRRQALLYPFAWVHENNHLVTEQPFADPRMAAVFFAAVIGGLVLLAGRGRAAPPAAWRAVIAFWIVSYILWELSFSIYRYTIPLEVTAGILIAGAIRTLAGKRRAVATAVTALIAVIIVHNTHYPNWGHIRFQRQAIPVQLPPIAPHTLVAAADSSAVSFIALAAPAHVTFLGAENNFSVPDTSLTWRRITTTIAAWPGPIDIVEPASGDAKARAALAAAFNLEATTACQPIISALNRNRLRLCAAHLVLGPPQYQPTLSLTFGPDGNATPFLGDGWNHPEPWGRWSIAQDASLTLPVNSANARPLLLKILAYSPPPGARVLVYANDVLVTQWTLSPTPGFLQTTLPAPRGARLTLRFHIRNDDSPFGIGMMTLEVKEELE